MADDIVNNTPDDFHLDLSNPVHVFAKKVAEDLKEHYKLEDGQYGFVLTVTIILMIISITISIIRFIYDCRHPRDIVDLCRNPGIFEKITVRRYVKKNMPIEDFKLYGDQLITSIFNVAATAKPDDVQKMYDKVRLG